MVFKKIAIFWQFPARSGVFSAFVMLGLAWQRCPFAVRYIQINWEQSSAQFEDQTCEHLDRVAAGNMQIVLSVSRALASRLQQVPPMFNHTHFDYHDPHRQPQMVNI